MTHTELAHSYFGLGIAIVGLLAAMGVRRPGGLAHRTWPVLVALLGLCEFLPVEAQTRTYQHFGALAVLASIVPEHPATWVSDWLAHMHAVHAVQHKLAALFGMVAGAAEGGVARGWLEKPMWKHVLPVSSIGAGLALGIHGGTAVHLPSVTEQMHHWMLGVAFVTGGVLLALHEAQVLRATAWRYAWPALVTLVGLDLAFFYRLHGHVMAHMTGM